MRGYKSILLLLFLAVNAFALTPNENITNIAASVKSSQRYSVAGPASNLVTYVISTNYSVDDYPFIGDVQTAFDQAPNVYIMPVAQSTPEGTLFSGTESNVLEWLTNMANIYKPQGIDVFQLDAGWGFLTNGNIIFHPARFPNSNLVVKVAHQFGIRMIPMLNMHLLTNFLHPPSWDYIERHATNLLDLEFDGAKFDVAYTGTPVEQWSAVRRFTSTMMKKAKTPLLFAVQSSQQQTNSQSYLKPFVNRFYVSRLGGNDPQSPNNFENIVDDHWHYQVNEAAHVRPGHRLEGVGWLGGVIGAVTPVVKVQLHLAAIGTSDITYYAVTNFTVLPQLTNATFLEAFRNPYVTAPRLLSTNLVDGKTNTVWIRALDRHDSSRRLVCFLNESRTTPVTFTINAGQMWLPTNVFSLQNVDTNTLITFHTNTASVTVGVTNTALFIVHAGFYDPSNMYIPGTVTAGNDLIAGDDLFVTNEFLLSQPSSALAYVNYVSADSAWHLSYGGLDRAMFNGAGIGWAFGNVGLARSAVHIRFGDLVAQNDGFIGGSLLSTNGVASFATNANLTMAAGGITNTTSIQYTIYGFTGTGVVLTNLSRPINITLGTITAPATIVLQPNDALMGTLCSAAGDRGF